MSQVNENTSSAESAPEGIEGQQRSAFANSIELSLNPARICRFLLVLIALIIIFGTAANVIIYHVAPSPDHKLAKLMQRFDLGHEPSIPAWYSSIALLLCSGLLGLIAIAKRRRRERFAVHWSGLSVIFLLMGLDEAVMIHEMADGPLHSWLNTSGILYFAWVIPGVIVVLCVGIAYLGFLRQLETKTRYLFLSAGLLFVAGAIGMELVAGIIFTTGTGVRSLAHTASQAVEESFEMLGVLLFLYALLDYIGRNIGQIVCRTDPAYLVSSSCHGVDA